MQSSEADSLVTAFIEGCEVLWDCWIRWYNSFRCSVSPIGKAPLVKVPNDAMRSRKGKATIQLFGWFAGRDQLERKTLLKDDIFGE